MAALKSTKIKIIVNRGEITVSGRNIMQTNISSCVSVCMYHPALKAGCITHISNSRHDDTTPSGRYIRTDGYFYADEAIPGAIELFRNRYNIASVKRLKVVVAGGLTDEGPIVEVLDELKKYNFTVAGMDVMENLYRNVIFDPAAGIITIRRKTPFADFKQDKIFRMLDDR